MTIQSSEKVLFLRQLYGNYIFAKPLKDQNKLEAHINKMFQVELI